MKSIKREDKKAQFYIIAAIIIIFVVVGLAAVANYLQVRKEPQKFFDIGSALKTEGVHVVDYGLYEKKDIEDVVGNFTELFDAYVDQFGDEAFNVTIIYGDLNNAYAKQLSRQPTGGVSIPIFRGGVSTISGSAEFSTQEIPIVQIIPPNQIVLNVSGVLIPHTLTETQNFFFVMTTSSGFNQYVKQV